jgi:hypothetical protein
VLLHSKSCHGLVGLVQVEKGPRWHCIYARMPSRSAEEDLMLKFDKTKSRSRVDEKGRLIIDYSAWTLSC